MTSGCFSGSVDVGDIGWGSGGRKTPSEEEQGFYSASFDHVWDAAYSVAGDLLSRESVESDKKIDDDSWRGKIKGRTKDGIQVEFRLEEKGAKRIEVKVKVKGKTGVARDIHARIRRKL